MQGIDLVHEGQIDFCEYLSSMLGPGWCVEGAAGVIVSGAGCPRVNGVYTVDGEFNGQPLYSHDSGLQLWMNHGQWRIGSTNNYYYVCNGPQAVDSDWEIATSQANGDACMPAPSVRSLAPTGVCAPPYELDVTGAGRTRWC